MLKFSIFIKLTLSGPSVTVPRAIIAAYLFCQSYEKILDETNSTTWFNTLFPINRLILWRHIPAL